MTEGSYEPTDIAEIAHAVVTMEGFTFSYTEDHATAYIVSIAKAPKLGGILPWGGKVDGMHLVSLRRWGSEFFSFYEGGDFHPTYLQEKLNLDDHGCRVIAELLNGIKERIRNGTA